MRTLRGAKSRWANRVKRRSSAEGCIIFRVAAEISATSTPWALRYNVEVMQRKVFWMTFSVLGIIADLVLPFWWAVAATIPVGMLAWWIAYRSDWF